PPTSAQELALAVRVQRSANCQGSTRETRQRRDWMTGTDKSPRQSASGEGRREPKRDAVGTNDTQCGRRATTEGRRRAGGGLEGRGAIAGPMARGCRFARMGRGYFRRAGGCPPQPGGKGRKT